MTRTLLGAAFLALFIFIVGLPVILFSRITKKSNFLYNAGIWGIGISMRLAGVRVKTEGVENIPPGACVFVANHLSNLDPPAALVGVPRRISFLAKKEIFKVPIVSTAMRLGKIIPVDRADREDAIASIDAGVGILRQGISFFVFPEGTRSKDGSLRPFKKGSFAIPIRAGAPVVPVAIFGSRERLSKGSRSIVPGEILLRFGPAINSTAYSIDERDVLLDRVRAAVAASLNEKEC